MLNKIVQAAGEVKSHAVAARVLGVVGEIAISGRHVNRLTEEIGRELAAKRDRETEDYVHHRREEPKTPIPQRVAIALDGGRLMTRESGQGPGVHGEQSKRTKEARTCVATMQDCHEFGKMVAAEAYRRNFAAAPHGALVGDGSAWIWNLQAKWFQDLTPVVDFVHALTYLYVTATVLALSVSERWQWYVAWMTQLWQGRVHEVIADLESRLQGLEPIPSDSPLSPTDPREVLRRTLTYLGNNAGRMNYPEYRKSGLPVSSSMVESLIKEVNDRVKGTEKFWDNPEGAEAILQVRAALLIDDDRLGEWIASRPGHPFRRSGMKELTQAA